MTDKIRQFKQPYLPDQKPLSPFEMIGGNAVLKYPIVTPDYVSGKTGFKLDPNSLYSKILAFGGNTNLYDAVVAADGSGQFKTIQDAINAGKRRIFVRAGTYIIKTHIFIPDGEEILITCEHEDATTISADASFSDNEIFLVWGQLTINGCSIFGNGYVNYCFSASGDSGTVYIDNCWCNNFIESIFYEIFAYAFQVDITTAKYGYYGSQPHVFHRCDFGFMSKNFINVRQVSDVKILFCNFSGAEEDGIILDNCNLCKITGNNMDNVDSNDTDTFSLILLKNTSIENIITENNLDCFNLAKYGIRENSSSDDYNLISNNIIKSATTENISTQGVHTIVPPTNVLI